MRLFREFLLVGGMPQSVVAYLEHDKSFHETDKAKRRILSQDEQGTGFSFMRQEHAFRDASSHERKTRPLFTPMELAALRYADHKETSTYIELFGGYRAFKANRLKQMRKKRHA